jgi:hypothetical protein
VRRLLGRVTSLIFPWPSREQRRAAISHARDQKERSRVSASHATAIEQDIELMAQRNHFASIIAEQIMRQQRGRQS